MKISDQKQYKKTVLPSFILDIVLSYSSCSMEQFMALTSLVSLTGTKLKHTFPGIYHSTGFQEVDKTSKSFRLLFTKQFSQWLLGRLGQEGDLLHHYTWVSQTQRKY